MQYLVAGVLAGSMTLFAGSAKAADEMTIAVFTKNSTNPAYEAFRIAADQIGRSTGARVLHFVPKQPDNVDEQKAMVEQVLKDRPDAVIFIPVDDVAMVDSVRKLNEAKIPVVLVSNPLPGSFVTYVGADDFEIGYREAHYLFEHLGGKGKIVVIEGPRRLRPTASACADTSAPSPSFPALRCSAPGSATTSNPTPNG
jgi:ribose transport system substrate-binding protein